MKPDRHCTEENLTDGTVSRVDYHAGDRIHQWPIRQISAVLRDLSVTERQSKIIECGTAVHEERADLYETPTEFRVPDHDIPITIIPSAHPVTRDMFDATADVVLTEDQRGIFHDGH